MDDFARSFHQADTVALLDIYAASEAPIPGVSSEALAARLRAFGHREAHLAGSIENAVALIASIAQPGDAVLTLGAGNVWQAGDQLLSRLRSKE
jgi:UDP-N-acetylmuramate--alanine ligase